jgi:hypothetical protein
LKDLKDLKFFDVEGILGRHMMAEISESQNKKSI